MKIYSLFSFVSQFYISTSVEIKPEFQSIILDFGYGINYKYEGMLGHSLQILCSHKVYVTNDRRFKIFKIEFR